HPVTLHEFELAAETADEADEVQTAPFGVRGRGEDVARIHRRRDRPAERAAAPDHLVLADHRDRIVLAIGPRWSRGLARRMCAPTGHDRPIASFAYLNALSVARAGSSRSGDVTSGAPLGHRPTIFAP